MAAASPARAWRAEFGAMAAHAWPLVLTNLAQALIGATDTAMLGRLGPRTLAAATLGLNFYFAFFIFGLGLVGAAAPLLARELGARAHSVRDVRRTVRQAMWAAALLVLPCWAVLWNAGPIMIRLLDQDPVLAGEAAAFVRRMMWGMLPALWFVVLRGFVAALERPLWSLVVTVATLGVNAGLNWLLIFGAGPLPALGLRGSGLASACANLFSFVAMAIVVSRHRRFRRYHLFGRFWRPDRARLAAVLRLGLPIALTVGFESTVFVAAVFLMGLIGDVALAAHAIAVQIATVTFMVPMGLAQAATVRVGLAAGRGDRGGIARAGWAAFAIGEGFMAATAIALLAVPELFVAVVLRLDDPGNAAVVRLAVSLLAVAALFQLADGAQVIGAGMLRGLHDTKVPMLFAALGYWGIGIGVGAGLAFAGGMGAIGIWLGLALGLAIVAVLMILRWSRREALGLGLRT